MTCSWKAAGHKKQDQNWRFFDKGHCEYLVNAQDNLSHEVSLAPDPRLVYDDAKRDAQ